MAALIIGLNITYDEDEKRGFLKLKLVALLLTLVGIVRVIIAVGRVAASPALIAHLQLGAGAGTWVLWFALAGAGRRFHARFGGAVSVCAEP